MPEIELEKKCHKCNEVKLYSEFHKGKHYKDGIQSYCKNCKNVLRNEHRKRNPEQTKNYHNGYRKTHKKQIASYNKFYNHQYPDLSKKYRREKPLEYLLVRLRKKSEKNNWEFNLDKEYLELIKVSNCPFFGYELKYTTEGKNTLDKATIDRIDNTKGYTKGNIAWISLKANTLKSDATVEQLQKLIK